MHALTLFSTTLFAFVVPGLTYQVTFPTAYSIWTAQGPNSLSWARVDTDAPSFCAILVNQNRTLLPVNQQVLLPTVNGGVASDSVLISPAPGHTLPLGPGFQVNLVRSAYELNTILAQSGYFTIVSGSGDGGAAQSEATSATAAIGAIAQTATVDPLAGVSRTTLWVSSTDSDAAGQTDGPLVNTGSSVSSASSIRSLAEYIILLSLIGALVV